MHLYASRLLTYTLSRRHTSLSPRAGLTHAPGLSTNHILVSLTSACHWISQTSAPHTKPLQLASAPIRRRPLRPAGSIFPWLHSPRADDSLRLFLRRDLSQSLTAPLLHQLLASARPTEDQKHLSPLTPFQQVTLQFRCISSSRYHAPRLFYTEPLGIDAMSRYRIADSDFSSASLRHVAHRLKAGSTVLAYVTKTRFIN
ncbi:unnamed protein product [Protopolystoma xenopodis]|uniref:Uncharacterized protein n=1 Tax=Protopolystoma xenopodis TaxID=117903 RepID=A0A448WUE6_9PLAT|nr:unnamed protein product [Protopolystoma xenopodis]